MIDLSDPPIHRRPTCFACERPLSACICRWITTIPHSVELLILQHPLEQHNPKNSARLLHLCLPHSRLVVGENFQPQLLRALLQYPLDKQERTGERQPVLLYPAMPALPGTAPAPVADSSLLQCPAQIRLVVLDATWRKSRKMLHCNPLLQTLPRLALTDMPPSQYRIRAAHRRDQLSTLEAACHALAQLEADQKKYQALLDAFNGFITQQAAFFRRS